MEDLGGMQWELLGTLTLSWIIVYLIIWKGLHASGKVKMYLGRPIFGFIPILDHLVHCSLSVLCDGYFVCEIGDARGRQHRSYEIHHSGLGQVFRHRDLDRLCHPSKTIIIVWILK